MTLVNSTIPSIPSIRIADLTVAYQRKPVLWEINLSIPQGSLVGLVGPNGAGKSTLIKSIMDMVPRISGSIEIHGDALSKQRHNIAYVPQRESVDWDFPATVLDVGCIAKSVGFCLFANSTASVRWMHWLSWESPS